MSSRRRCAQPSAHPANHPPLCFPLPGAQVRPWVCPNIGFVAQLREFERLGKDTSKWRAWRHVWRDQDPLTVPVGLMRVPLPVCETSGSAGSGGGRPPA